MSELERLIEELCPDGVEYKPLRDFATITRGGNFQKKDFAEKGIPCIHYGQIYTRYGLFADRTFTRINKEAASKSKFASQNDIVMAVTSENVEDVCKSVAWLGLDDIAVSGHTAIIRHNQNSKYLSYYFHSSMFFTQKVKLAHGTKVIEVTPDKLNNIFIPIPPLPIQQEIVRILDAFTELEARKRQYEYYCRQLIDNQIGVNVVRLRELGKWYGGGTPATQNRNFWESGTIPWISSKDMIGTTLIDTQDHITPEAVRESSTRLLPPNTVAVVVRSGILKHTLPIVFIPFAAAINQDIKALVPNSHVSAHYVAYALRAYHGDLLLTTKKAGGTVDSIDFDKFMNFPIPVPPLSEQARIVEILDRFDALTNDITQGLPAELAARCKQ